MNKRELTTILEDSGMEPAQVDEILVGFDNKDATQVLPNSQAPDLKAALLNEPDWRKRASIAARILGDSIEY